MSSALIQWEQEQRSWWYRRASSIFMGGGGALRMLLMGCLAFFLGAFAVSNSGDGHSTEHFLGKKLRETEIALKARQGELELLRLELSRVQAVMEFSAKHKIPADLAAQIYDIALAEGIEPALAYNLVRVESGFYNKAISPVGAVGLTQVMPSTAWELDPTLRYADLFNQETNLRLGFRYLRQMLDRYDGDLRLALLAYNRGPGTVDRIRRVGGDPANGYDVMVLGN